MPPITTETLNLIPCQPKLPTAGQLKPEADILAVAVISQHGVAVANIAALTVMSASLFNSFGKAHQTDLLPLLKVQAQLVEAWAAANGVSMQTIAVAVFAVRQAAGTVRYISTLPN